MRVLMLGGGTFVGRALVDAAVAGGHEVTTFTRTTEPPAGVEALHGDRTTTEGIDLLAGREWDVVFDTWSGAPRVVQLSVSALQERVGYYGYVSSASVYGEWGLGSDETHPTVEASPDAEATDYPADKRGAELAVLEGFGEQRCLLARAGTIVGPYESTGRLVWWVRRIAVGGDVLAPGPADSRLQWVDARDLAAWMLTCAAAGTSGAFNAVSAPGFVGFGEVLQECMTRTSSGATLVWVPPEFVEEQGISEWIELPLWLTPVESVAHNGLDTRRAAAAGLICRPAAETIADTWAWIQAGGEPRAVAGRPRPGLDPAKEQQALAAWASRR
ncbi:MAG TPA: NAD-dependent epimerase/dehydratase family protein [Acidothermaceae bacterium]|jgi:2'-hydroxyisoflavone reductase|nr:NAD-dependent epimerase/dehydratase family protein [Acidothermaceae bacterium]